MIASWWNALRARRHTFQYESGYDWAAGQLLAGKHTVSSLTEFICVEVAFEHAHSFDKGVWQAIDDWKRLRKGEPK